MTLDTLLEDPGYQALVGSFVDELANRVDSITAAAASGDRESLITLSHQLAGAGGSYGFGEISQVAGEIERHALAGTHSTNIEPYLTRLRSTAQTIVREWNDDAVTTG